MNAHTARGWRCGETHQRSTVSDATVDLIRLWRTHGRSYRTIVHELQMLDPPQRVAYITVQRICTGATRTAVPAP